MPGRHLSNREQDLTHFWREPDPQFPQPLLKGVTLDGPPTLRGIQNIHAPFNYPITAICGKNGAGKSTVLALAAFSATRPGNWRRLPSPMPSVRRRVRSMTFAWDEFFFRRLGDPPLTGLSVQFHYTHMGNDLQLSRVRTKNGRWSHAPDPGRSRPPRLPQRPIDFVSLSRILPPAELRALRRQHSHTSKPTIEPLSPTSVQAMSYVLGQQYSSVEVHTQRGLPLAHCRTSTPYNAFDMGSGESSTVAILSALERLPVGGLLLIEEVEHGFHPQAQQRLVEQLTRIVSTTKKQIICTTHSEYIIDALPQAGRVLIERGADGHNVTSAPTTRQAMFSMTGAPRPELTVYVEDTFAETLVRQAVPGAHRTRIRLVPIGSGDKVVAQLATHLAAPLDGPAVCVVDGDFPDKQLRKWVQSSQLNPMNLCLRLPSQYAPERWALETVLTQPYSSRLARALSVDHSHLITSLEALQTLPNPHNIPREIARQHAIEEMNVPYILGSCLADHPDYQGIREAVASHLDPAPR